MGKDSVKLVGGRSQRPDACGWAGATEAACRDQEGAPLWALAITSICGTIDLSSPLPHSPRPAQQGHSSGASAPHTVSVLVLALPRAARWHRVRGPQHWPAASLLPSWAALGVKGGPQLQEPASSSCPPGSHHLPCYPEMRPQLQPTTRCKVPLQEAPLLPWR